MRVSGSVGDKVAYFLENLPLLSVVERKDICGQLNISTDKKASALSALDYYAANTGVSKRESDRSRPAFYFAIRMPLSYANNARPAIVYLSLPGIPRHLLKQETADTFVQSVIAKLQHKYGTSTVNYWCRSAQRRSVDFGRHSMRKALLRDGTCKLCAVADKLCQVHGLPSVWGGIKKITACHLVARKTIFWSILDEIEQEYGAIFSDPATDEFRKRMQTNKWHSDSRFISGLCQNHDKELSDLLTTATI